MLNGNVDNIANFRQGGASTRSLRDNPKEYAGLLPNAYVARNGGNTQPPKWPKHPSEGGHPDHAFDLVKCLQRMQRRSCDDWRSSGDFLINARAIGVFVDVIPDPCYERPLCDAHHLPPINAATLIFVEATRQSLLPLIQSPRCAATTPRHHPSIQRWL
jgi:hypothetical protein